MPIVVVDIAFHLVAGRRRSPEKIRRKHVAHVPSSYAWNALTPAAWNLLVSTMERCASNVQRRQSTSARRHPLPLTTECEQWSEDAVWKTSVHTG